MKTWHKFAGYTNEVNATRCFVILTFIHLDVQDVRVGIGAQKSCLRKKRKLKIIFLKETNFNLNFI